MIQILMKGQCWLMIHQSKALFQIDHALACPNSVQFMENLSRSFALRIMDFYALIAQFLANIEIINSKRLNSSNKNSKHMKKALNK